MIPRLIEGVHDLTFPEQLKIWRLRQGWSALELGKRLGVGIRTITMMETGVQAPSSSTKLLLVVLQTNPKIFDHLFTQDGPTEDKE